jgi:hypothetical protein
LIARRWSAIALVLGFAWACDYTPDLPPAPPTTPRPPDPTGGAIPVVVIPVPAQTPMPIPVPTGAPVPSSGPIRIVSTTPEEFGTIRFSPDRSVRPRRPIIDFELRYPQSLTLDNAHTNIRLSLVSRGRECLSTDLGYATRLDRNDTVYVANTVARFQTGPWVWLVPPVACGGAFATEFVWYTVGPNLPAIDDYTSSVAITWNFLVQ